MTTAIVLDGVDGDRPLNAGPLAPFVEATVLAAADVHVARLLGRNDATAPQLLAAALAVRAIRLGHTCVELDTIADSVTPDDDVDPALLHDLDWPGLDGWLAAIESWDRVAVGDLATPGRPLRLVGQRLHLDRYWRAERQVAAELLRRADTDLEVDDELLAEGLARLFHDAPPDLQRLAAAMAVRRSVSVIAGGPGTGKTTTVARVLALITEQALAQGSAPRIALAAPTGKAAARLHESVQSQLAELDVSDEVRAIVGATAGSTMHRLLGWRPGNRNRFRHDRSNQLAHDLIVVDETSMVSLSMMASLIDAVRPSARLILLGDPDQLVSVEAGAVLGDIVGPAAIEPRHTADQRDWLAAVSDHELPGSIGAAAIGDSLVVLTKVHRFGGGIADLAAAIRAGDDDQAVEILAGGGVDGDLSWLDLDAEHPAIGLSVPAIRSAVVGATRELMAAGSEGDARAAVEALGRAQLLCAHRGGPYGVSRWRELVVGWLRDDVPGFNGIWHWYAGQPLLVTQNDYSLGLFNGDTGVVVQRDDTLVAAFDRQGEIVEVGPSRLAAVETPLAMTIHKSQGSQFETVHVVLPDEQSPLLTRELLYTAVTRASRAVTLVATEAAVRAAIARPVARASGLRNRLWADG